MRGNPSNILIIFNILCSNLCAFAVSRGFQLRFSRADLDRSRLHISIPKSHGISNGFQEALSIAQPRRVLLNILPI